MVPFLFIFFILLGCQSAKAESTDLCTVSSKNANATSTAIKSGLWSDPAIWNIIPCAGKVNIPAGITVTLDKSINVAAIDIYGTLNVQDSQDISITAGYIMAYGLGVLKGTFEAGTAQIPFVHHLTITLNGLDANAVPNMGGRVLGAMNGGRVLLYGKAPAVDWMTFKGTVLVGSKSISLQGPVHWQVGQPILIATGIYPSGTIDKHTIAGISHSGNTSIINLDSPLLYTYYGGQVSLAPKPTWTMLNATAAAGSKMLILQDSVDWQVGDKIIITSTDVPGVEPAAEERVITSITNNNPDDTKPSVISLNSPLTYQHYGRIQYFKHNINPCPIGVPSAPGDTCTPTDLDERAEVGLLTHNIVVEGAEDTVDAKGNAVALTVGNLTLNSDKSAFSILQGSAAQVTGFGGHTMIMGNGSVGVMQGVELVHMGQNGISGRYPMHWHGLDTASAQINPNYNPLVDNYADAYLRGSSLSSISYSSIHDCFQRFVTIHKTSYISLHDNVAFNTNGHGFFIEDGREVGNVYIHNLGVQLNNGLLLTNPKVDKSDLLPAMFWTANPNNDYINNAAAGGRFGFWYDIPSMPAVGSISANPSSCLKAEQKSSYYNSSSVKSECYSPSVQPFGVFSSNRAHSNGTADPMNNDMSLVNFDIASLRINGVQNAPLPNLFSDMTVFKTPLAIWSIGDPSINLYRWHVEAPMATQGGHKFLRSSLLVNTDRTDNNPYTTSNSMANFDYDGNANGVDDVFIGYKALIQNLLAVNSPGTQFFLRSQLIDTNIYTPITKHFEEFDEMIPDMDNSVGNGVGAFVNQPWNIDSACKGGEAVEGKGKGALGIDTLDTESYWCPYIYGSFNLFSPGKQWLIASQQNGNYVPLNTGNIKIGNIWGWMKTNQLYWLKPVDGDNNIDFFSFNALTKSPIELTSIAPIYPPNNKKTSNLTLSVAMPLPDKPFNLKDTTGLKEHAVYQAKSLDDFNSRMGEAWFVDPAHKYLYLKSLYNVQSSFRFVYTPLEVLGSKQLVNAACGTIVNTCAVGSLDAASLQSSYYYSIWSCKEINGGKKVSCFNLLPINASCGSVVSTCLSGKTGYPSIDTGSSTYNWQCQGYFGGTSQNCSASLVAKVQK